MGCSSSRSVPTDTSAHPRVNYVDELDRSRGIEESRMRRSVRGHSNSHGAPRISLTGRMVSNPSSGMRTSVETSAPAHVLDITSLVRRYERNGRSNVSENEINQLQNDLDTLERLFQTLLGQSVAAQLAENFSAAQLIDTDIQHDGCPPASDSAIDNLTCITVSESDLVDECNRECCICFFPHSVGDTDIARLPCGHIFHKPCISEWLEKKCTCPLCRYEIRTDNEMYEIDRIERMRARKIRVRSHELERMSTADLQQLTATNEADHDTLLDLLRSSANIEILETPPIHLDDDEREGEGVSNHGDESTDDHDPIEEQDSKMPAQDYRSEIDLVGEHAGQEKEKIMQPTIHAIHAQSIASGLVTPNL